MKKIKAWVNRLKVGQKVIFYGYLTLTPVLILIGLALLLYSYSTQKDKTMETARESVTALADGISVVQRDIKDISTYIAINNDVRALLTADDVELLNKDARIWEDSAPIEFIQNMISLKGQIKTLAIYSENGIRPFLRGMDNSVHLQSMEEVRESSVYQATLNSANGILWKDVGNGIGSVYSSSRTEKVIMTREIYDLSRKTKLGYLVIGVQKEYFTQLCENIITSDQDGVLVLDPNGGELSRAGYIDEATEEYLLSQDFIEALEGSHGSWNYNRLSVVAAMNEEQGTIVCKIMPRYSIRTMIRDNYLMPIIIFFGMLFGLMPLLLILSNMVTKPIKKLNTAIKNFSTGDFTQQVEVSTEDEIGEVAETFNKMVLSIQQLIDENYVITLKEKESELSALQAQINPHFLYNTLDLLYWQAMEEDNEELAESILALSRLFRLVLNQGKKEVTVGQEVELVSLYLQIQQMRFSKNLEVEIDVDDDIKEYMIPKLLLQPFVENAVVHGFEDGGSHCVLSISGERKEDRIHFEVRDTGVGMSQKQIEEILNGEEKEYRRQRIGHYAIYNIRERLRLKYKTDFTLDIQSAVGEGTGVILEIPIEED